MGQRRNAGGLERLGKVLGLGRAELKRDRRGALGPVPINCSRCGPANDLRLRLRSSRRKYHCMAWLRVVR